MVRRVKTWVLTPANIPQYAKETGQTVGVVIAKYRKAVATNQVLMGYTEYWEEDGL